MKRVLTALLLIPLVVYLNFRAPAPLVWAVMTLVALLCLRELFGIAEKLGLRPYRIAGYGAGGVLIFVRQLPEGAFLVVACLAFLVLTLRRTERLSDAFGAAASTLFGVVYTCGPFALARELHLLNPHWLFVVLLMNWVGDAAALYVGQAFGRHALAQRISPHKTWEGAAASTLFSVLTGVAYLHYFQPMPLSFLAAFLLAFSINAAAQVGDLAESALKRGAELKDSGRLLPGHGGMLDRLDGLLFALPACYVVIAGLT